VHVYVDRHQRRPKSLPQALRQVLESILIRPRERTSLERNATSG
jgi:hypothetical protein